MTALLPSIALTVLIIIGWSVFAGWFMAQRVDLDR
jgi:hypothetical protein